MLEAELRGRILYVTMRELNQSAVRFEERASTRLKCQGRHPSREIAA
jgi:hypothetical protein